MSGAKNGDTVLIHYTTRLDDGSIYQTTKEDEDPLEFTLGEGEVIPAFEKAVVGMNPGETRLTAVKAEDAFGAYSEDLKLVMEKKMFPAEPEIGDEYGIQEENRPFFTARVVEISDLNVIMDANHSLAGKDVTFEIELMEIH